MASGFDQSWSKQASRAKQGKSEASDRQSFLKRVKSESSNKKALGDTISMARRDKDRPPISILLKHHVTNE
uniref:Uncharacterized protein n=1 Tax=Vespula pensylvanica TaxID=30213 RepID=A0A834UD13_VESPE|nr:hypothetical protein H0235_004959 [Vespula pensylvanica]